MTKKLLISGLASAVLFSGLFFVLNSRPQEAAAAKPEVVSRKAASCSLNRDRKECNCQKEGRVCDGSRQKEGRVCNGSGQKEGGKTCSCGK